MEDDSKQTSIKIPPLSQLCWNCKRAVNSKEFRCSWADNGTPIKGWTAHPNTVRQSGRKPIETYYITECPLYVKDKPWGCDYVSAVKWLAKELDTNIRFVQQHYQEMLKKYEQLTGAKLPLWLFEKERRKDYNKSKKGARKEDNCNVNNDNR